MTSSPIVIVRFMILLNKSAEFFHKVVQRRIPISNDKCTVKKCYNSITERFLGGLYSIKVFLSSTINR